MVSEEQVGQEAQPEDSVQTPEQEAPTPEGGATAEQASPDARPSEIGQLKNGMRLKGRVSRIVDFGAFVDIGVGRDGLAHISTLQRAGIDKTLRVGDVIDVQVRRVELERNRISLTVPGAGRGQKKALEELRVGSEINGRVVRLVDFGAFVDVGAQTDGLLHISELSSGYVNHPREVLEVGQEVQVRILDVDTERRRLSLSMKDLENEPELRVSNEPQEDHGPSAFAVAWQEALENRSQRQRRDRS
jgi:small subunit ribosomal protein S1